LLGAITHLLGHFTVSVGATTILLGQPTISVGQVSLLSGQPTLSLTLLARKPRKKATPGTVAESQLCTLFFTQKKFPL